MSSSTIYNDNGSGGAASFESADFLSDVGRARRDAMLPLLQDAVVRQGRRRRLHRSAARGTAAALLVVLGGVALVNNWPISHRPPIVRNTPSDDTMTQRRQFVSIIHISPGAVARHTVKPDVDLASYIIDDNELVTRLAIIGRPTGLIRSYGKIRLTAAVTDAELARNIERPGGEIPSPLMPSHVPQGKRPS